MKATDIDEIEKIGWHDCPVYSMKFDDHLEFDIDFITEWKLTKKGSYQFMIAPASLIFKNVTELKIEIKSNFLNGFEIDEIQREDDKWIIELQEGQISFVSPEFDQILRKAPILKEDQFLSEIERS